MLNTYVRELNPASAAALLKNNSGNRPVSRKTVHVYSTAMQRGEWQLNGEPIIIGKNGRMLNGQHRCHAVISSKTSVPVLFVEGVDDDSFKTLDTGKKRSGSDVLAISGKKNTNVLNAAARAILRIERGGVGVSNFTNSEIMNCVERHPTLDFWTSAYSGSQIKNFATSYVCGVMALTDEKYGRDVSAQFWEQLNSGVGLDMNSPAYHLRERFIGQKPGHRFTTDYSIAICIKAVNAHATGRPMGLLRWGVREDFPTL